MPELPLKVVDGLELDGELRALLLPGETMRAADGRLRRLPRYFYEVPSWEVALETALAPDFAAWEFLNVDVREAERLRTGWPRYLPCAVTLLAGCLQLLRQEVGTYVHIAANGAYRSPAHRLSVGASPHNWGTAANIYRIGDDWLDNRRTIVLYSRVVGYLLPGAWMPTMGAGEEEVFTHLHFHLGFVTLVPPDAPGEDEDEEEWPL